MIIDLTKSELFSKAPHERFADEYDVGHEVWTDLWRRYKLLNYKQNELAQYLFITTGIKPSSFSMSRWIRRTEVYQMTYPAMKKGARCVSSEIFGDLEFFVINEVTKNLRSSATRDTKIAI